MGSDDDEDDFDIAPATSAPSAPGPSGGNGSYAPLEGLEDEDEDMEEDNGMEMTLHGVDGQSCRDVDVEDADWKVLPGTKLFYTRTRLTMLLLPRRMERMWRLWSKRKMLSH